MPAALEIKRVLATHVEYSAFKVDTNPPEPADVEAYAGWMVVTFPPVPSSSITTRDSYDCFLPINNNREIREYKKREALLGSAVTCSCSVVATDDDEANVLGVDFAKVSLVPMAIPKLELPICLMLTVDLAALHGKLVRISYHVTVQMEKGQVKRILSLDPDTLPVPQA